MSYEYNYLCNESNIFIINSGIFIGDDVIIEISHIYKIIKTERETIYRILIFIGECLCFLDFKDAKHRDLIYKSIHKEMIE